MVIASTAACLRAVRNVVGPVKALPGNLHKGFYQELGFDGLVQDSEKVKGAAQAALNVCDADASQCANLPQVTKQANTTAQRAEIQDAFLSSLGAIERVATDQYFGTEQLQSTADNLRTISQQLDELNTTQCMATNEAYCGIYSAADSLVDGAQVAFDEIDKLIDADAVRQFEERADKLALLHALPYPLVLSMLFFTCFWKKDAACCCCGGSFGGCILLVLHMVLWFASLLPSLAIVAVSWTVKFGQDRINVGSPVKGNPTLAELLSHIETAYPGFWDVVIAPLEDPLNQLYVAASILLVASIFIGVYGLCLCSCRPYTEKAIG